MGDEDHGCRMLCGPSLTGDCGTQPQGAEDVDCCCGIIKLPWEQSTAYYIILLLAAVFCLAITALLALLEAELVKAESFANFEVTGMTVVFCVTLFFIPSLLPGMVSPIFTKLALDLKSIPPGATIGIMFAAGTLGAIAGTILSGYLFIAWLGAEKTVVLTATAYGVMGLAFFFAGIPSRGRAAKAAISVGVMGISASATLALIGFQSRCHFESSYTCGRTVDFDFNGRPERILYLDQMVNSINDKIDPTYLALSYVQLIDEIVRRGPPPLRVFLLGGGGYTLPRAWAVKYPEARMEVAEIDPVTTAAAEELMWFNRHAGVTIYDEDGRPALQSRPAAGQYDYIIGDTFSDVYPAQHLLTQEFNDAVAMRLKHRGYYLLNIIDVNLNRLPKDSPLLLSAVLHTLRKTFASVEFWVDDNEISPDVNRPLANYIVVAGAAPLAWDRLEPLSGPKSAWHRKPLASIGPIKPMILTDDLAPVDRLLSQTRSWRWGSF